MCIALLQLLVVESLNKARSGLDATDSDLPAPRFQDDAEWMRKLRLSQRALVAGVTREDVEKFRVAIGGLLKPDPKAPPPYWLSG